MASRLDTRFEEEYFRGRTSGWSFLKGKDVSFYKYPFWNRLIKKRTKGGSLLDIGCGEGYLLAWAIRSGYVPFGLDVSHYAIGRLRTKEPQARLYLGNVEALPFRDESFDVITCFDVLEHISDPSVALGEVARCLRIGGLLVLSVPNTMSRWRVLKGSRWFGYRDQTHVSLLRPDQWGTLVRASGLNLADQLYDTPWDPPYFEHVPILMQRVFSSSLVLLHYWTPLKFPPKWGEDVYMVARKR